MDSHRCGFQVSLQLDDIDNNREADKIVGIRTLHSIFVVSHSAGVEYPSYDVSNPNMRGARFLFAKLFSPIFSQIGTALSVAVSSNIYAMISTLASLKSEVDAISDVFVAPSILGPRY